MQRVPRYVMLKKKRGETPLEALHAWKKTHPEWKDMPASYAGRLDPMAEGKLLVLLGDECKRQAAYTGLDKEYEIEVLLDLATDTGDVLGLAEYAGMDSSGDTQIETRLSQVLAAEIGTYSRAYPAYSSKTVAGKPLFLHQLEGKPEAVALPFHDETIYRITRKGIRVYTRDELSVRIQDSLRVVPRSEEPSKKLGADFRQDAIRAKWQEIFASMPERRFLVLRLRVICGSGTYMRTLAERLGKTLGTSACAFSINRTRIGRYRKSGPWFILSPWQSPRS